MYRTHSIITRGLYISALVYSKPIFEGQKRISSFALQNSSSLFENLQKILVYQVLVLNRCSNFTNKSIFNGSTI